MTVCFAPSQMIVITKTILGQGISKVFKAVDYRPGPNNGKLLAAKVVRLADPMDKKHNRDELAALAFELGTYTDLFARAPDAAICYPIGHCKSSLSLYPPDL